MIPIRPLDRRRRDTLRILYLAPHAPHPGAAPPGAVHPDFGVQPAYHHEIHDLLVNGLGLEVACADTLAGLEQALAGCNYVFSLYNIAPFRNSEVHVSSLAAAAGIACLGAPPNVRALLEDKWFSKLAARALGIPCPRGQPFGDGFQIEPPAFPGPYIAKPRFGAASMDIGEDSVSKEFVPLRPRIAHLASRTDGCLVEAIAGEFDITVPLLIGPRGPLALPPASQKAPGAWGIFTHRQKRRLDPGLVREFPPDAPWLAPIVSDAIRFAAAVRPWDYLRCDFRFGEDGHAFLECNAGCSLGSQMAFAQSAASAGISLEALVGHIIATSLDRQWGTGASTPPELSSTARRAEPQPAPGYMGKAGSEG